MRKGTIAGIVAAALAVPAVVVPLTSSNGPAPTAPRAVAGAPAAPRASVELPASPGAPIPDAFGSPGSCPQVFGAGGSITNKLVTWLESFAPGSTVTLPYDACYITNGLFRVVGLNGLTINGNGATLTQNIPGLHIVGGSSPTTCGNGYRWQMISSSNTTISNLNLIGAWDGIAPSSGTVSHTSTGTPSAGVLPLNSVNNLAVGELLYGGVGSGLAFNSGAYYVTAIDSVNKIVDYSGTGSGVPKAGFSYTFQSNGGQHCEGYGGIQLQADTNISITNVYQQNVQGDGFIMQSSTDPSVPVGHPVNANVTWSRDTDNGTGYDGLSIEGINGAIFTNDTFENASENNMDLEVDVGQGGSTFVGGVCAHACQNNLTFKNNLFKNQSGDFYLSPQGFCPGVQQQNVQFIGNTIKVPGTGMNVAGTQTPVCQTPVTFTAVTVGTDHGTPFITVHGDPVTVANGSTITDTTDPTTLTGTWLAFAEPTVHEIFFEAQPGAAGGPVAGHVYDFLPPQTSFKFLTVYLTFKSNVIQTNTPGVGFKSPFGGTAGILKFVGVNVMDMENNVFPIFYSGAAATNPVIDLVNVNGATIKNNNFSGGLALFGGNLNGNTGVIYCGNTWGTTDAGPTRSSTGATGNVLSIANTNNVEQGQRVTGPGLTGTWTVLAVGSNSVTITPSASGSGSPSSGSYSFFNDDGSC